MGRSGGRGGGPRTAPIAVPYLIADLKTFDVPVTALAVIAGGDDTGKGAHLGGGGKEIHAVTNLGFAETGGVLDRDRDVQAGRGGGRHIPIQAGEVVEPRRGLARGPRPLQPNPFDAPG